MKILFTLLAISFSLHVNAGTYLLLSETNDFAAGITNEAKAYANTKAPIASPAFTGTPTINGQSVETQLTNRVLKAGDTMTGVLTNLEATNPLLTGLEAHAQRQKLFFDDSDLHNTLTLTNNDMALMRFRGASAGIGGVWIGNSRPGDFAIMVGCEEEGYPVDQFRAKHTSANEYAVSNDGRISIRANTGLTPGNIFTMTERMAVTTNGVGIWDDSAVNNRMPIYSLDLERDARNQLHISKGIADSGLWIASGGASDGGLSVGATYNGSTFTAKGTEAGWLTYGGVGNWYFRANTGLTVGNSYTPSTRLFIQGSDGFVGIAHTSPTSTFHVAGSSANSLAVATAPFTVGDTNDVVICRSDGIYTNKTAVGFRGRRYEYWIVDPCTSVTITNPPGVTINGVSAITITTTNVALLCRSDGTNWWATKTTAP